MLPAVLLLLLVAATPAVATTPEPAQPGDGITVGTTSCTLGFLFTGSDGRRYMSTAGHCAVERDDRRIWSDGQGPVVRLSGNADGSATARHRIGSVVFAEFVESRDGDDDYDFALIMIDPDVPVSAKVRGQNIPTGVNNSRSDAPALLRLTGQGTAVATIRPTRELLTKTMKRPEFVYADGVAIFGDSGGPVLDAQGAAVGTLLGAGGNSVSAGAGGASASHDASVIRIGRLMPVLAHAAKALRLSLRLQTT